MVKAKTIAPSKALEVYRSISRRIESRFMKLGKVPFPLWMISSAKEEHAFLEQYVATVRKDTHVAIFDDPVYKVKPMTTYSGLVFDVAVGDKYHDSFVLRGEDKELLRERGFRLFEVPVEYRRSFDVDLDGAIRDILGVSVSSSRSNKLIANKDKIVDAIEKKDDGSRKQNPMKVETIVMGLESNESIADYVETERLFGNEGELKDSQIMRVIHIDTGLTGDALGLCMGHTPGKKDVSRISMEGTEYKSSDDIVRVDIFVRIKARAGSEIPLWKVREFISYLTSRGVKIWKITADGFQSRDMLQLLTKAGYQCELVSVDKTDEAYVQVKNAILEDRFLMPEYSLVVQELSELEHDRLKHKVDHTDTGTKDVSDALAGVVHTVIADLSSFDVHATMSEYAAAIEDTMKEKQKEALWYVSDYQDVDKIVEVKDVRGRVVDPAERTVENNFGLGKHLV